MIGGRVIIEQVNQTRKTEEENRKWGWAAAEWKEIFFFLLELLLNNCTAVCISVRAGCQAAYDISRAGERGLHET